MHTMTLGQYPNEVWHQVHYPFGQDPDTGGAPVAPVGYPMPQTIFGMDSRQAAPFFIGMVLGFMVAWTSATRFVGKPTAYGVRGKRSRRSRVSI